ncbi:MAG: AAA family ATPase, partial [Thiogranum sp.]|nr:AAA family ATPase [Thiogranum sp.]
IGMTQAGYNVYVVGDAGMGRRALVKRFLDEDASERPVPDDWCYVNNFEDPGKPRTLQLPPGRGAQLRRDMQHLVEELRTVIPAAFESDDFKARIQQIENDFQARQEEAFRSLNEEARRDRIRVFKTPGGFTFAPLKDDKVLDAADFQKLPKDEQQRIDAALEKLEAMLQEILQKRIPQWSRERRERIRAVTDEVTMNAVGHLIDSLREKYESLPEVLDYLDAVKADVIANTDVFLDKQDALQNVLGNSPDAALRRYKVNLLVDNAGTRGAPVIYEDNPTYIALIGRIEHTAQLGALSTDFTLIRPGALHTGNGGYLILDVRKLLTQPYAWDGLKRALYAREVCIESLGQMLSLVSTVSLEPQSIPLHIKVVLLGERLLYYLLCAYDPDFLELFKVSADFEDSVDRTTDSDQLYARLVATLARRNDLLPFDRSAVAAVIEQSMRMVGDQDKLSTHMRSIADLLRESSYWAGQAGLRVVRQDDVRRAVDYKIERVDRVRDRMHEAILRGTLMIDTSGTAVGQINGVSVIDLGEEGFGVPTRITATTRLGEGELVDIEREVDLAGPIHSKGVFILSSYLGSRYAPDYPLSLSASLTFEQSYGEVEGDSASLAELCALLSSLSGMPIRQSLAVTGSVNQRGQVQPVGGVNEKIEGFFNICNQRGLTGEQGVIIPDTNMKHLMLRMPVVEAVQAGRFNVYAVAHADQALELLTGTVAGVVDEEGLFPDASVNGRVQLQLRNLAGLRLHYAAVARDAIPGASLEEHEGHAIGFRDSPRDAKD